MGACDKYMKEMGPLQINMHRHGKPGNIRKFENSGKVLGVFENPYGCRIFLVLFSCEIFSFIFQKLLFFLIFFFIRLSNLQSLLFKLLLLLFIFYYIIIFIIICYKCIYQICSFLFIFATVTLLMLEKSVCWMKERFHLMINNN